MLSRLLDIVYPRNCVSCATTITGPASHYVCHDCMTEVSLVEPPFCRICGDPVAGRIDHSYVCFNCSSAYPHFDVARSAAKYDGLVKRMIQDFKYSKALWLASDLSDLLTACAGTYLPGEHFDLVTCVPLHHTKRRERSYNQAGILAKHVARELDVPYIPNCLYRNRRTTSQTRLTATQRATNVIDAVSPRMHKWLDGRSVLLIDDVMTTGSTVNECARALRAGGAARVAVVTVARG
ncbi:MAG: ComF family protein [Verrucomicrobia bacterium]|nr:ComF family protein [Verrucomicrobiota bacterium]